MVTNILSLFCALFTTKESVYSINQSIFMLELKTERNLLTEGYFNGHSDPWEAPLRKRLFFSAVNPCS